MGRHRPDRARQNDLPHALVGRRSIDIKDGVDIWSHKAWPIGVVSRVRGQVDNDIRPSETVRPSRIQFTEISALNADVAGWVNIEQA
jgi:hypothetical protein